jgi:multidrug resistance protein, MATE family
VSELKTISRHAGSVLAGQLATMAFGVTDTIVAGRYGQSSLAALSVGSAIYMSIYVGLMGVLQPLLPAWAELYGARQHTALGRSVRQALYLGLMLVGLGIMGLLNPGQLLNWGDVPDALRSEITTYLALLALALPPALLFRMYSTLNQSLGKPLMVTWLQLGSLLLKVPLSIWFTFGGLGLPAQGLVGCAWATLLVNYAMLGLALWLLRHDALYQPYRIWQKPEPPHWPTISHVARQGIPSGLAILVEVTSFTLMALFIARQGTVAAASHQIAANLAAVLYMVPLAIGIATSARISFWLGAGHPAKARHAVSVGFGMVTLCALSLAAALVLARYALANLYASSPPVVELSATLLLWVAAFHLFDGLQALAVFVLRCFRITLAPLLVYCVLLWGLGLYGGYRLAYLGLGPLQALQTPAAFWMTASVALAITALLFWGMVWQALGRASPKT